MWTFSAVNKEHDISLTLMKCCEGLNISIKKMNDALVVTNIYCIEILQGNKLNILLVNI